MQNHNNASVRGHPYPQTLSCLHWHKRPLPALSRAHDTVMVRLQVGGPDHKTALQTVITAGLPAIRGVSPSTKLTAGSINRGGLL